MVTFADAVAQVMVAALTVMCVWMEEHVALAELDPMYANAQQALLALTAVQVLDHSTL